MKAQLFAAAALVALGAAGASQAASPRVEIKRAVARVVVIPEDRADIKVEIIPGRSDLPAIDVRQGSTGKTIINGHLGHRVMKCSTGGSKEGALNAAKPWANTVVALRGIRNVRLEEAPLITIRTPMRVEIAAGDGVYGSIGRAASVDLAALGCGDWSVGNVQGELNVMIAGSGDIMTGSAGPAEVSVIGSGNINVGAVTKLDATIPGSGDIVAERVEGPVEAQVIGSGSILVRSGRVTNLDATIPGSGNVTIERVEGNVEAAVIGSGDIRVKNGRVGKLDANITGSGNIQVDAPVTDLEADIVGGGDIRVASVSGKVDRNIVGSGRIDVGSR